MRMIVPLFVGTGKGKRKVAVLVPKEWHLIETQLNADYKIRGNFLLQTAMRISEAKYVAEHPECVRKENMAIFLPRVEEIGKKKCKIKNRAIMLSPQGMKAVEDFFEKKVGFVSYTAMEAAFKRAARDADFDTSCITTKMLRKTMISWLVSCFPEKQMQIEHSAGHTFDTMSGHYVTFGFGKENIKDMKSELEGWGES